MARRIHSVAGGPVTTSGAVTNTIASCDMAALGVSGAVIHVEGVLIGKEAAPAGVTLRVSRAFHRVGGVLTALGNVANIAAPAGSASLLTSAGVLDLSGDLIRLRATGVAALDIEWTGYIDIWTGEHTG